MNFLTSELLSYMLFADEAKVYDPMAGVSTFTKTFPARGPRDKQGRSLRDFDLQTRLFRYPLSYMIYDPVFDALPNVAKNEVYRKLFDVLTGKQPGDKYRHLAMADRRAILEISLDTKANLPGYWRAGESVQAEEKPGR
jgi:hypothetical protein